MSFLADSVVIGFGYTIYEFVSSQQPQKTGASCRMLSANRVIIFRLWIKQFADVLIPYALNMVFSLQYCLKQFTLFGTDRTKGAIPRLVANYAFAYRIQEFVRWCGFSNNCERLKVALISCSRYLYAPAYIGNAFTHP